MSGKVFLISMATFFLYISTKQLVACQEAKCFFSGLNFKSSCFTNEIDENESERKFRNVWRKKLFILIGILFFSAFFMLTRCVQTNLYYFNLCIAVRLIKPCELKLSAFDFDFSSNFITNRQIDLNAFRYSNSSCITEIETMNLVWSINECTRFHLTRVISNMLKWVIILIVRQL